MPIVPDAREQAQLKFQEDLTTVLQEVQLMLYDKNRKYGDSALNPKQTFSRCDPIELINVRMDDKLSRIGTRANDENEDAELDLLGYLLIKRVAMLRKTRTDKEKAEYISKEQDGTRLYVESEMRKSSAHLAQGVYEPHSTVKKI